MTVSRREVLKKAGLAASSAALPSWLAQPLLAQAAEPVVRHSVTSGAPAAKEAIEAYRAGVAAMQRRAPHQPNSWQFQANIHAWPGQFRRTAPDPEVEFQTVFSTDRTNEPLARKVWGTCTHVDSAVSFLPWHRLYLYFFERMVFSAAGPLQGKTGLPYWDWTKDRSLPLPFREAVNGSQSNNSLYWNVRRASVTRLSNPIQLPNGTASSDVVDALLAEASFSTELDPAAPNDFNSALEGGPHGDVHVFVGVPPRGMGFFEEAGRDPIFWVHHCNIDRLWSHWSRQQGHLNPVTARVPVDVPEDQRRPWGDVAHTFVDENGRDVTLTTEQVLAAAEILGRGYTYDDLPMPAGGGLASAAAPPPPSGQTPSTLGPAVNAETSFRTLASAGRVEVGAAPAVIALQPQTAAAAAPPPPGSPVPLPIQKRVVVLKEIAAAPEASNNLFGVYVNLPLGEPPTSSNPSFVGTVNTFHAVAGQVLPAPKGGGSAGAHAHRNVERRLPIDDALAKRQWKEGDPITVTIAPIQLDDELAASTSSSAAAPPPPGPALTVGRIDVIGF